MKQRQIETRPTRRIGGIGYRQNPFWGDALDVKIGKRRISVASGVHTDQETGETISHSGIHVVQEVDSNEFLKVYAAGIRAIFDLKPSTQRVLQYLLRELQKTPGVEAVWLNWFEAADFFSEADVKMSRPSFHRAISELIGKQFLAESMAPGKFWFNPHLFFNGNRVRLVQEYRITGGTAQDPDAFNLQGQTPAELAAQKPAE